MTLMEDRNAAVEDASADHPVTITRKRIDVVLVWLGAVAAVVLLAAGGLLMWGSTFASDYVGDELAAQNITFPPEETLVEGGRQDLVPYAGELVDTGSEAEAYASYIAGHIDEIGEGQTYADLGGPERAAKAAVTEAAASGASAEEIAALQETADELSTTRETIFRGEMLRGTLLNTYAWSTIGRIAGIAAWVAFAAGAATLALVAAGLVHLRKLHPRS